MPKLSKQRVEEELDIWAKRCAEAYVGMAEVSDATCSAVVGHFKHPKQRPWKTYTESIHPLFADIVG